jgi:hypothetical protein
VRIVVRWLSQGEEVIVQDRDFHPLKFNLHPWKYFSKRILNRVVAKIFIGMTKKTAFYFDCSGNTLWKGKLLQLFLKKFDT